MKKETPLALTAQPRIIQLLFAPNNSTWQGVLLGLGDDGVTYECDDNGRWKALIPEIGYKDSNLEKTT